MRSLTRRRFKHIGCLIFVSGLLLMGLSMLLSATAPVKAPAAKSSPRIYALLDIGKGVKSVAHEQYREDFREWYTVTEHPWIILRITPAAKLDVVRTQKDPPGWLMKNLHAEYLEKTDILRIWLSDGSLHEQAAIIDTIIRSKLQRIERDTIPSLKEDIARSRRYIALNTKTIVTAETELHKLANAEGVSEQKAMRTRRNLERAIAYAKKSVTIIRTQIEDDEADLRTLPRVVKWAGKPGPEG